VVERRSIDKGLLVAEGDKLIFIYKHLLKVYTKACEYYLMLGKMHYRAKT
jgi:hypothetical protein